MHRLACFSLLALTSGVLFLPATSEAKDRKVDSEEDGLAYEGFTDDLGDDPEWDDPDLDDPDFDQDPIDDGPVSRQARSPAPAQLNISDKTPLADNFPARVVSTDVDALTVELPVLVARTGSDLAGKSWWLVTSVLVNGARAGESRTLVDASSVADLAPTVVWIKTQVPVNEEYGTVSLHVSRVDEGGEAARLFVRSVDYTL